MMPGPPSYIGLGPTVETTYEFPVAPYTRTFACAPRKTTHTMPSDLNSAENRLAQNEKIRGLELRLAEVCLQLQAEKLQAEKIRLSSPDTPGHMQYSGEDIAGEASSICKYISTNQSRASLQASSQAASL